jgi:hypothetical protein
MDNVLAQPIRLVSCSVCLRVLHDSEWIPAEVAIRELHSYGFPEPVGLAPGLCDDCSAAVAERRGRVAAGSS